MSAGILPNSAVLSSGTGEGRRRRAAGRSIRFPARARSRSTRKLVSDVALVATNDWDLAYGLPVLRGDVTIGELAFLAVERHYRDLLTGAKRGLTFSPGHAWHVIDYIQKYFVHLKGSLGGTPILLDPWQRFWTAVLYGWLKADGTRRFNIGYEEVARKNGKSTWKSAQGGYLFMMDREPGAEVYSIATTRDQAMAVFAVALANFKRWCRKSKKLERSFAIHDGKNQEQILYGDASVFRPLPANADSLDGKNPHAILFDELHAQKTSDVWDVMVSAFGSRLQWLLSAITTAGFILDGICVDQRNYLVSILKGDRVDDAFFGYIYTLDEGDDVFDEVNWLKANPGLGSSKTLSYMQSMAKLARALPSALANFKTKDLNLWVNSAEGWLDKAVWEKGGKRFDPLNLRGRRCFGAADLSSTQDLTALALVFPPIEDDPDWYVLAWTYCPRAKVTNQADDMAPYAKWEKAGHLTVTEGDVVDYEPMSKQIQLAAKHYDLVELAYDKWNSTHLMNELDDAGIPLVEVPQRFEGMFPGSKLLEMLVYGKKLRHNANPVLQSAAMNVSLLYDTNGNFRPDKKKSMQKGRIDPIVAVVMALSRAWVHDPQDMSGFTSNPIMVGV